MNIKELKYLIKDLPDEMPVVQCHDGDTGSSIGEPDIYSGKIYVFNAVKNYGPRKGETYQVEFCRKYKGNFHSDISEYDALIFYTGE